MTTRDPRTGLFVTPANVPESSEGKFPTYAYLPVGIQGADLADLAYDTVPRHGPDADDIAPGGTWPLYSRHPVLVSMDEHARTAYGQQGSLLRDAARLHGLTGMLAHVVGLEPPTGPSSGVRQVTDDGQDPEPVRSDLRLVSRGQGRARGAR